MGDFELPVQVLRSIRVPVVAVAGEKTTATLKRAVQSVADTIPGAQHRLAPKMSHAVKPAVLALLLRDWLDQPVPSDGLDYSESSKRYLGIPNAREPRETE